MKLIFSKVNEIWCPKNINETTVQSCLQTKDGKVLTANWRAITLKAFNSNLVLSGPTAGRINQVLHLLKDGRNSKTQLQWSHLKWKRICIAELVFFQILKVIKFKLNTQITCQIKVYSKSKLQCFIKEVYLKCYVYTCIIFPGLIEITVCWGLQYLW